MGHKRLGILPKSRLWRNIVAEMGEFGSATADITSIATNTLKNVQIQYSNLENDPSIRTSFEFLLQVAHAFQKDDPVKYLRENNIINGEGFSPIGLAKSVTNFKPEEVRSNEYKKFASQVYLSFFLLQRGL